MRRRLLKAFEENGIKLAHQQVRCTQTLLQPLCFEFNLAPVHCRSWKIYSEAPWKDFWRLVAGCKRSVCYRSLSAVDVDSTVRLENTTLQDYRYRSHYHLQNNVLRQPPDRCSSCRPSVLLARTISSFKTDAWDTFTSEQVALALGSPLFSWNRGIHTHKSLKKIRPLRLMCTYVLERAHSKQRKPEQRKFILHFYHWAHVRRY